MYKVYCDDLLIFDTRLDDEDYVIFDAKLSLELNKTGTFKFTIYPKHPRFSILKRMKSIITVYQKDYLIFRGRILNENEGFYNEKQVSCEGELAFLCDSIQRPYDFYTGTRYTTIPELFTFFINRHNEQVDENKQFKVGNITVTDENNYITRSSSEHNNTLDEINDKLIDSFGGYLWVRHEEDGNYIDYLSDFSTISNQPITFGKNLLDIEKQINGEELATAIIPLGAKVSEGSTERLSIADINGGVDYVYNAEAVKKYGWIFKTNTWDDVTDASNLLRKANALLSDMINLSVSIEVTAADLSGTSQDFTSFHLGTYVSADSSPHDLDSNFIVQKLQITLMKPSSNKLTLGKSYKSFTEQSADASKVVQNIKIEITQETDKKIDSAIEKVEADTEAMIDLASGELVVQVSENTKAINEANALISTTQTVVTQNQKFVEVRFNELNKDINDVAANSDAKFTEISEYIRFEGGDIELGASDSDFKQKITRTKNSFYEGNDEVAYVGNKKLYITDGEFLNSLRVGKFAWLHNNGQKLRFKKVVR